MKSVLVIYIVLAFGTIIYSTQTTEKSTNELTSEEKIFELIDLYYFQEFTKLSPTAEITELLQNNKPLIDNARNFMNNSKEFKTLLKNVALTSEIQPVFKFFTGFNPSEQDIDRYINNFIGAFYLSNLPEITVSRKLTSMKDLTAQFLALMPIEDLKIKIFDKLEQDWPRYRRLVKFLRSSELKELISKLSKNSHYQKLMKFAEENDIPLLNCLQIYAMSIRIIFNPKEYPELEF